MFRGYRPHFEPTHFAAVLLCTGAFTAFACSSDDGSGTGDSTGGAAATGGSSAGTGGGPIIDIPLTGGSDQPEGGGPSRIEEAPVANWIDGSDGARAVLADGLDASIVQSFASATEGGPAAPTWVYPLAKSMHPRNLTDITFHWNRVDPTWTSFMFEIEGTSTEGTPYKYQFYAGNPCSSDQCSYKLPNENWHVAAYFLADTTAKLRMVAYDGAGTKSAPVEMDVLFSPEDLFGALYYWAAATATVKRASIGSGIAQDFITPSLGGTISETNQFECTGCHSVSRDGTTIAFAVTYQHGEDAAAIQVADTKDPTNPFVEPEKGNTPYQLSWVQGHDGDSPASNFGHNVALNPTGTRAIVNGIPTPEEYAADLAAGLITGGSAADAWPPYVEIRDARTGARIKRYYMGDPALLGGTPGYNVLPIHPEWSPGGDKIVASLADHSGDNADFGCVWTSDTCRSAIAVYNVIGDSLQLSTILVQHDYGTHPDDMVDGTPQYKVWDYHFYPTWSPDGQWIAFVTARFDKDRDCVDAGGQLKCQKSLSNPNGVIRMVRAAPKSDGTAYTCPSADCIDLATGATYGYDEALAGTGVQSTWPKFAPFAQRDDFSVFFISFNSKLQYGFLESWQTAPENQIWMFAVDTRRITAGEPDPSYAPIWLPVQEAGDSSITPYWTTVLPCTSDPGGGCAGCVGDEVCIVETSTNSCYCKADLR